MKISENTEDYITCFDCDKTVYLGDDICYTDKLNRDFCFDCSDEKFTICDFCGDTIDMKNEKYYYGPFNGTSFCDDCMVEGGS